MPAPPPVQEPGPPAAAEPTPSPAELESLRNQGRALLARRDAKGAAELFERACNGGDLPPCVSRTDLLDSGRGVAEDAARVEELYRSACAGGMQNACDHLGH